MCGRGLHSFDDPDNVWLVFNRDRDRWQRRCRPCAIERKRGYDRRKAEERAKNPPVRPWWAQLEWTGPHRVDNPWKRSRRRKRSAQNYKVNGHPIAYKVSPQQVIYLQGLADGLTLDEIAERENVTLNTVRNGLCEARTKYGVSSNAAAVAQGLKRGVLKADRDTARRLPYRVPAAAVEDVRALVRGERLPHKAHGARIWRTLDPLMSWTEAHAVSVLWAAGRLTSRHVPQTRNRYQRRRLPKRTEDRATWKATAHL
ncbi:LuxR C-terminal-related transcriptional regulator [Streptomyces chartreusis]